MKVFVYYNLHKKKWSVKALEGPKKNKVIHHSDYVYLRDVTPKVSQRGRARVLLEKSKNVHAGLVGTLVTLEEVLLLDTYKQVSYNPYFLGHFYYLGSEKEYKGSPTAYLENKKVYTGGGAL